MNINVRNFVVGAIVLGVVISGISIFAAPGDSDDPIISLSYINEKLKPQLKEELKTYIDEKTNEVSANQGEKFTVIPVDNGKKFFGGAGTEFIVRMGGGKVIASEKGGVVNVTSGVDLANGAVLPSNALLIVPIGDGRGFEATADVLVMVKGGYTVQ